jgi:hypothetical protein
VDWEARDTFDDVHLTVLLLGYCSSLPQIVYRYFNMKAQNDMLRARLQDVNEIVKAKSPSLLLAIKKTPLRQTQQLASTTPSSTVQARAKSPSASGNGFSSTAKRLR